MSALEMPLIYSHWVTSLEMGHGFYSKGMNERQVLLNRFECSNVGKVSDSGQNECRVRSSRLAQANVSKGPLYTFDSITGVGAATASRNAMIETRSRRTRKNGGPFKLAVFGTSGQRGHDAIP
jgi:hypothetical protein